MISAVILAAGRSSRMGEPKMLLPWGERTVIEQVITTFLSADIEDLVIVTGGAGQQVEGILRGYPVRAVHNSQYEVGEMLSSLQCGLRAMQAESEATLVGLGDQPQVQADSIRRIGEAFRASRAPLVVPSFQMRRGHPWLVARPYWGELLALRHPASPREFLNLHAAEIEYVTVESPSILADLDTPEEYRKFRPRPGHPDRNLSEV